MSANKVIFILGQTASGKTKLSLLLAKALGAEVVNSDAFSFYRNCDVMTAKVAKEERGEVPHHMLDILDVGDVAYTVNDYCRDATKAIGEIHGRGKPVIVVGGSNYYAETLLYTAEENKSKNQLKDTLTKEDKQTISELLGGDQLDEIGALLKDKYEYVSVFHAKDVRRLRNEYQRLINPSSLVYDRNTLRYPNTSIIVLKNDDADFTTRAVGDRIEAMIYREKGLEEVMTVLSQLDGENKLGQDSRCGVLQAIGYKEFRELYSYQRDMAKLKGSSLVPIKDGVIADNKASELVKAGVLKLRSDTLRLVKKQRTWIKNRVLENLAITDRILVLHTDTSQLDKASIDAYFQKVVAEFIDHLNGKPLGSLLKPVEPTVSGDEFHCKRCNVNFSKKKDFKKHRKSLEHKGAKPRVIKPKPEKTKKTTGRARCDVCDRLIPATSMKNHVKAKSHKRKEKRLEELQHGAVTA